MTLTTPKQHRSSTLRWVPAAAGWSVGVIATLSLIASISPLVRFLIKVPREWVNDYIFNFPDTSFAWAFVLALLAAALAARKSVAWWILLLYMVAAIGWNVGLTSRPVRSRSWRTSGSSSASASTSWRSSCWCSPGRSSGRGCAAAP